MRTLLLLASLVVGAVAALIGFDVITVHDHAGGWFPLAFVLFVAAHLAREWP